MPNEKPPRGFAALRWDTAALSIMLLASNAYWWFLTGSLAAAINQQRSDNAKMKQNVVDLASSQIAMLDSFAEQARAAKRNGDWVNWSIRAAAIADAARDNPDSAVIAAMFDALFKEPEHAAD